MLKHRHIDRICGIALAAALLLTLLLLHGSALGLVPASSQPGYASRLLDDSRVHSLDLVVEDWQGFLAAAPEEEYIPCRLRIDGEDFSQVGLRAKGNNSRRLTEEYGLSRYSLKLEFDHYQPGQSYHGLDKLSLDAAFQDNSYLKTWLVYDLMAWMGVPAPLCSFVWVTVNGSPWGLFLAVEEPEEAFARRNFGPDHGQLYKPEYRSLRAENADIDLRYIDDDPGSYPGIFQRAKFELSGADRQRLIAALRQLSTGQDLEQVVEVDRVLRYFAAQVFVLNPDSYLGPTGHNYFLYEEDGRISMLPWDYNLAFGTYCLGMSEPIRDEKTLLNYPVLTPWEGSVMLDRPLFHQLMQQPDYFAAYQGYLSRIVEDYVLSGRCEAGLRQMQRLIAPYVRRDPTAFCSPRDQALALESLLDFCRLRARAIGGQLAGEYPATLLQRSRDPEAGVEPGDLDLRDLGDFDDLRQAKARQDEALQAVRSPEDQARR